MYTCYPYESFNKILLSAIHGTYRCEMQAAKTIGTYQYLIMKLKDITDERTIDTISKMDCNIERPEREDKVQINKNCYVFGRHSSSSGNIFYKGLRMSGQLFEAQDFVRQRSFNNSTVLLDGGRYVVIN